MSEKELLIEKIEHLPESFLKYLNNQIDIFQNNYNLEDIDSFEITKISESSLKEIWDNEEDSVYDKL